MPADELFEAREWGDGRISGTPVSGGNLTDLEVRFRGALAGIPTQAELDTALESVVKGAGFNFTADDLADLAAQVEAADLDPGTTYSYSIVHPVYGWQETGGGVAA